jgi:hypothetical protein
MDRECNKGREGEENIRTAEAHDLEGHVGRGCITHSIMMSYCGEDGQHNVRKNEGQVTILFGKQSTGFQ